MYELFDLQWHNLDIDAVLPPLEPEQADGSVWERAFEDRDNLLHLFQARPGRDAPVFKGPGNEHEVRILTDYLTAALAQAERQKKGDYWSLSKVPNTMEKKKNLAGTLTGKAARQRPFPKVSAICPYIKFQWRLGGTGEP